MRSFFESLGSFYTTTRTVIIVLDIVLLFVFTLSFVNLYSYHPRFIYDPRKYWKKHRPKAHSGNFAIESWKNVTKKLADGSPEALRLAVIEADSIVDGVLKRMGYQGDTFADRLSHLNADTMPSVDRVWDAHRLRNDLVHTPGFMTTPERARSAIGEYEAFLRDVNALGVPPPPAPPSKTKSGSDNAW